ncbi:SRPBCC family protein [Candidatus Cyanaurora vandensis]|uniref:SRPBCC family protein n=1 Tax=Candidatus Cyanaurora vandensis TaxID=2714958 RepID=UPI00257D4BF8|nr:SRPBCC family protein [Candidatus Cyanaurora vandensis]
MLERTVELVVAAPVAKVYELWADLKNLPQWMQYVDRVSLDPVRLGYSQWRFGREPLFVEWTARITRKIPLRLVAWESVAGLANRGQIEFFPVAAGCRLRLTVAVAAPGGLVGAFIQQVGLGHWLDENLLADLKRFARLVEHG